MYTMKMNSNQYLIKSAKISNSLQSRILKNKSKGALYNYEHFVIHMILVLFPWAN